ncbi:MAG: hypothetical protein K6E91_09465 [Butyrivibrio sp.]|nr:hypothetical protein [Butyrivibrio sp.]
MDALQYAAEKVKIRYPYFSVKIRQNEESYVMEENDKPFVISLDGTPKCLSSAESNDGTVKREQTILVIREV